MMWEFNFQGLRGYWNPQKKNEETSIAYLQNGLISVERCFVYQKKKDFLQVISKEEPKKTLEIMECKSLDWRVWV